MKKLFNKTQITIMLGTMIMTFLVIAGTLAFLTSRNNNTATITVGKVRISMDVNKADLYGQKTGNERGIENTYKLIPGSTYVKDPIVSVSSDSVDCYVFVRLENTLGEFEGTSDKGTVADQLAANNWIELSNHESIYYLSDGNGNPKTKNAGNDYLVFECFKVDDHVTTAQLQTIEGTPFSVTPYAVQAYGFTGPDDAWNRAFNQGL